MNNILLENNLPPSWMTIVTELTETADFLLIALCHQKLITTLITKFRVERENRNGIEAHDGRGTTSTKIFRKLK